MQHSQHYIVLDKAEDTHTSVLHLHCTQQHSWLTLVYSQHYIVLDKTERYTHISSTSYTVLYTAAQSINTGSQSALYCARQSRRYTHISSTPTQYTATQSVYTGSVSTILCSTKQKIYTDQRLYTEKINTSGFYLLYVERAPYMGIYDFIYIYIQSNSSNSRS